MLPIKSVQLSNFVRFVGARLAIAGLFAAFALIVVMMLVPGFPPVRG